MKQVTEGQRGLRHRLKYLFECQLKSAVSYKNFNEKLEKVRNIDRFLIFLKLFMLFRDKKHSNFTEISLQIVFPLSLAFSHLFHISSS